MLMGSFVLIAVGAYMAYRVLKGTPYAFAAAVIPAILGAIFLGAYHPRPIPVPVKPLARLVPDVDTTKLTSKMVTTVEEPYFLWTGDPSIKLLERGTGGVTLQTKDGAMIVQRCGDTEDVALAKKLRDVTNEKGIKKFELLEKPIRVTSGEERYIQMKLRAEDRVVYGFVSTSHFGGKVCIWTGNDPTTGLWVLSQLQTPLVTHPLPLY